MFTYLTKFPTTHIPAIVACADCLVFLQPDAYGVRCTVNSHFPDRALMLSLRSIFIRSHIRVIFTFCFCTFCYVYRATCWCVVRSSLIVASCQRCCKLGFRLLQKVYKRRVSAIVSAKRVLFCAFK